ncbi:MAG: hypothetical protein DI586_03245 [Micavibrio aeruginosavorus]|uniref:DUF2155 domain-containing protein n=1 Tax=Micavibrio aeruginosavorus TaxID=349221 RepID=A0A2W5HEN4_9BACT|nr:MAG: hypothetical protein DI586_03245 [Micavibrio aeruginosavorus]
MRLKRQPTARYLLSQHLLNILDKGSDSVRGIFLNKKNIYRLICLSVIKKVIFLLVFLYSSNAFALAYEDYPVVKLRSLDKITARTMTFEAKVGSTVRFGEIYIKVQACRKPPPVEKSEAASFLQVWQSNDEQKTSKWIFSGWMFASSPALSAMNHPVYDVWVLDCLGRDPEPIPPPEENTSGVQTPATDGEAPDAVPPPVEPDTQQQIDGAVSREEDPGAFEGQGAQVPADSVSQESVPSSNMPPESVPVYTPPAVTTDEYRDETPLDDSSPVDDTMTQPAVPETLEPQTAPAPETQQEFEGIY